MKAVKRSRLIKHVVNRIVPHCIIFYVLDGSDLVTRPDCQRELESMLLTRRGEVLLGIASQIVGPLDPSMLRSPAV